jgi:hypothetical protein
VTSRQFEPLVPAKAQLNAGLPVHLTRMLLAMASDRFDLSGLIDLLTAAAEREFAASGAADVSKAEGYGRTYEKAAGRRAEQLRDSYMLHRILEAKAAGDRLAGLGDAHRRNLEGCSAGATPRSWSSGGPASTPTSTAFTLTGSDDPAAAGRARSMAGRVAVQLHPAPAPRDLRPP